MRQARRARHPSARLGNQSDGRTLACLGTLRSKVVEERNCRLCARRGMRACDVVGATGFIGQSAPTWTSSRKKMSRKLIQARRAAGVAAMISTDVRCGGPQPSGLWSAAALRQTRWTDLQRKAWLTSTVWSIGAALKAASHVAIWPSRMIQTSTPNPFMR